MVKKTRKPKAKKPTAKAAGSRLKASRPSLAALRNELRSSERRFRLLVETAAAPIFHLAPDLSIVEANPEAERLTGRGRDALIGSDFFAALGVGGDPSAGLSPRHFAQVFAGQPVRALEGRIRRPDGAERVLLWNATSLHGPSRTPRGAIAVAQDITERVEAEDAVREREARLRSIISTAPDAILTIDARGVVQSFSATAEKLFGYAAEEVVGRNVKILMPEPHRAAHDGYIDRYLSTGEKRIIGIGRQVEGLRKDGTVFPMELAVGEVRLGATHIFTGFIRDISARAKLEQDLRHAQKMEAIGQLTGGVAHDFNNLLTVITGNLEMLERRLQRDEDRELLAEAQGAADLGAKLAGRLLAFGRRQPLHPKPIELGSLVGGMLDLLRRTLGEAVRIETRLAKTRTIVVDPGQVENALLNLAINARDAMPDGGKLIIEAADADIDRTYAAAHGDIEAGSYVMLAVSDTGIGMTPEVRQRAFEPFFTTKGPASGSGLGLSMVYGFVKQSGGYVQLYSEPGLGTSVRVYLPASAASRRGPPISEQEGLEAPRGRETILVVEDDEQVRKVSIRRLRDLGYTIIQASDGPSALALVDKGAAFDLLFTDMVMPGGMTGVSLARAVRERRPNLPVLLTSGYADPALAKDGMLTERADWLPKPYTSAVLASKLRRLLDR